MAREGVRHLYLMDFDASEFASLESGVTRLGAKVGPALVLSSTAPFD